MNFPTVINIELTSACNKGCFMCGRRKKEKEDPAYYDKYSQHMPFPLLEKLAKELKGKQVLLQFHWDGDPTVYPRLGDALKLFEGNIRCFNTNGKLIVKKADEIIDNLETLTLSTFEGDWEREEQWKTLQKFLEIKGDRKPNIVIRRLGNIPSKWMKRYEDTGLLMADRILHAPEGSFKYTKKTTKPEYGICLEALMHPAINVNGNMSQCVRYDPDENNIMGNVRTSTIEEIWNGEKRKQWLEWHISGQRHKHPMCSKCEFWGIPRGD
jgi:radical SAM protein with 4Fe4S-binding SPASM domain